MTLTQDLGHFVAGVSFAELPQGAADVARTGFIDCIATMIAGAGDPAPQLLRKALHQPSGDATLYFSGEKCPAPEAAWINGTAGHALDYDDVASLRGHPSTVLVPAILAEGETLGASGRDMLAAYVAGYETWAEPVVTLATITAKAGIRLASSARSVRRPPARHCGVWNPKAPLAHWRWQPRRAAGSWPISAR
jgi:2-methylcitrate dehydratase PrpD